MTHESCARGLVLGNILVLTWVLWSPLVAALGLVLIEAVGLVVLRLPASPRDAAVHAPQMR